MISIRGVVAFVLLLCIGIIVRLPAAWVAEQLDVRSAGMLKLESPEGTLWSGKATGFLLDGQSVIEAPVWSLSPWALLTARLGLQLQGAGGTHADLTLSSHGIHLGDTQLPLPANLVARHFKALARLQPGGVLVLHAKSFGFDGETVEGGCSLDWQHASSALVDVSDLGDYRLGVTTSARGGLKYTIATLSGVLQVDGDGDWSNSRGLSVRLRLKPEPSREDSLRGLLSLAGQPAGDGTYYLNTTLRP